MSIYTTNYMYRARRISHWGTVLRNPFLARARNFGAVYVNLAISIGGSATSKPYVDETEHVTTYYSSKKAADQKVPYFSGAGIERGTPPIKVDPRDVEIYISDVRYYGFTKTDPYLVLDFVPKDLEYSVETRIQNLGIVGLNYPKYHFGGSEDTLSFTIDWYDYMGHKDRVIEKCRKMEALTKANGYRKGPPVINIKWGTHNLPEGDSGLFENHFFIVKSATYQMSLFLQNRSSGTQFIKNGLRPLMATQRVVLKRVGSQLNHSEIIGKPIT